LLKRQLIQDKGSNILCEEPQKKPLIRKFT